MERAINLKISLDPIALSLMPQAGRSPSHTRLNFSVFLKPVPFSPFLLLDLCPPKISLFPEGIVVPASSPFVVLPPVWPCTLGSFSSILQADGLNIYNSALCLLRPLLLLPLAFQEKSRAFNMHFRALESNPSLSLLVFLTS